MKYSKTSTRLFATLTLGLALGACGDSSSDGGSGTATATLAMTNSATALAEFRASTRLLNDALTPLATTSAPSVFQIKLIAAYIAQDIDESQNNVGGTSFIYLNPDCEDDIMHCDISGGTAEDGASMAHVVTSYFDLSGDSATVNASLNAQSRSIEAASYKYVRLEFCKYNSEDAKNIKWQGGSMSSAQELQRNMCTVTSAVMDPALEVADGDNVTINLAYDYSAAVSVGTDASGDDCNGTSGTSNYTCFTLPTFTPSASK